MDEGRKSYRKDSMGAMLKSLEGVQVGSRGATTGEIVQTGSAQGSAQAATPGLAIGTILGFLQANADVTLPDIAAGLNSPIVETAQLVGTLQTSGLVEVAGGPGGERVRLTAAGRTLATAT